MLVCPRIADRVGRSTPTNGASRKGVPQIVEPEMFLDAGLLNRGVMRFSHAANREIKTRSRRKYERALRLLCAPLQHLNDVRRHGHFPPRCFCLAKWIEDCPFREIDVFDPDSEDLPSA